MAPFFSERKENYYVKIKFYDFFTKQKNPQNAEGS